MSAPTSGSSGSSSSAAPAPGYYPDPSIPNYIRYWNGSAWVPGTSRPAPLDTVPSPGGPEAAAGAPGRHDAAAGGQDPGAGQNGPGGRDGRDSGREPDSGSGQDGYGAQGRGADPAARQPAVEESGPMFLDEDPRAPRAELGPDAEAGFATGFATGTGFAAESGSAADQAAGQDPRAGLAQPSGAPDGSPGWPRLSPPEAGLPRISWGSGAPGGSQRDQAGAAGAGGPAAGPGTPPGRSQPPTPPGLGGAPAAAGPWTPSGLPAQQDQPPAAVTPRSPGTPERAQDGPRLPAPGTAGTGAYAADAAGAARSGFPPAGAAGSGPGAQGAGRGFPAAGAARPGLGGAGGQGFGGSAAGRPAPGTAGPAGAPGGPGPAGIAGVPGNGPGAAGAGWAAQVQGLAQGADVPWRPPADDPFAAHRGHDRPGGLVRRFAARVIDAVVMGAITGAAAVPLGTAAYHHAKDKVDQAKLTGQTVRVWLLDGTTGAELGAVLAVFLVAALLLEVLPTARWGRTPGKKLVGLRVLDIEGQLPPGFGASLRRWLVRTVLGALAVGVVGVAWCLFDRPWKQCWHDKAARTFVAGV